MSAASEVCHHCSKQGHYKRNCLELLIKNKGICETTKKHSGGKDGSGGAAGQTWCSHHNTTTHSGSECYAQGGPRPQQDSAYTTCSTQCSHHSPDGDAKKSELNFGHDFDGGFLFTSTTTARPFLPYGHETAPVDAHTTDLAPSAVRGLLTTTTGIINTAETSIITITRGLWELVTHKSTTDEKMTLSASVGAASRP